ncbi:MAG: hypothetical protein LKJ93_07660, partial [Bacteroidales bacterium]|nr:hypothetical protein [Bacteroidales bacterium]
ARNEYFFIAEADLDIFPDGKGLTPVNMKVLHQEEETPSGKKSNLMDKILEPIKVIVTESDHGPETEEDNETEAVPETDGKPEDKEQIKDESEGPEEAEEEMQGKLKNESVERKGPNTVGIIFIILGCILFLAIVAYGILYVCRDQAWVDKILYNSEERELLKYLTK